VQKQRPCTARHLPPPAVCPALLPPHHVGLQVRRAAGHVRWQVVQHLAERDLRTQHLAALCNPPCERKKTCLAPRLACPGRAPAGHDLAYHALLACKQSSTTDTGWQGVCHAHSFVANSVGTARSVTCTQSMNSKSPWRRWLLLVELSITYSKASACAPRRKEHAQRVLCLVCAFGWCASLRRQTLGGASGPAFCQHSRPWLLWTMALFWC